MGKISHSSTTRCGEKVKKRSFFLETHCRSFEGVAFFVFILVESVSGVIYVSLIIASEIETFSEESDRFLVFSYLYSFCVFILLLCECAPLVRREKLSTVGLGDIHVRPVGRWWTSTTISICRLRALADVVRSSNVVLLLEKSIRLAIC